MHMARTGTTVSVVCNYVCMSLQFFWVNHFVLVHKFSALNIWDKFWLHQPIYTLMWYFWLYNSTFIWLIFSFRHTHLVDFSIWIADSLVFNRYNQPYQPVRRATKPSNRTAIMKFINTFIYDYDIIKLPNLVLWPET